MRNKTIIVAILAVTLIFTLTACAKTQDNTTSAEANSSVQKTEQQDNSDPTKDESSSTDEESSTMESAYSDAEETPEKEAWKKVFEEDLFQKYGVIPEYYENLGDGIYQVYVKIDGKVVPYVTVNSATGDYHG